MEEALIKKCYDCFGKGIYIAMKMIEQSLLVIYTEKANGACACFVL